MFITTLIAASMLSAPFQASPTVCPVMGSPTTEKSQALDYNGARFRMCCAGCDSTFKANAATIVGKLKANSKAIGEFLFDPTTGVAITPKKAKASSDYMGIRYYFATAEGKTTFDKAPKTFTAMPKKEVLGCVVNTADQLEYYAQAGGYVDHKGVRYYVCCPDCLAKLKADPEKYTAPFTAKAKAPAVQEIK